MQFLPASSTTTAQSYNDRAWTFCQAQGNMGSAWSDLWTDGVQFAIIWDNSIAPAFTSSEISTVTSGTTGTWSIYGTTS